MGKLIRSELIEKAVALGMSQGQASRQSDLYLETWIQIQEMGKDIKRLQRKTKTRKAAR